MQEAWKYLFPQVRDPVMPTWPGSRWLG